MLHRDAGLPYHSHGICLETGSSDRVPSPGISEGKLGDFVNTLMQNRRTKVRHRTHASNPQRKRVGARRYKKTLIVAHSLRDQKTLMSTQIMVQPTPHPESPNRQLWRNCRILFTNCVRACNWFNDVKFVVIGNRSKVGSPGHQNSNETRTTILPDIPRMVLLHA